MLIIRNLSVAAVACAATAVGGYLASTFYSAAAVADDSRSSWLGTVCPQHTSTCKPGPVVQVTVTAQGQPGDVLHYKWRSSDGSVWNTDAPTTTWKLPPGPGLHFVYVLVSNRKGGYTERRALVNTDQIGTPLVSALTGRSYSAPPAPAVTTITYRSMVNSNARFNPAIPTAYNSTHHANVPNTAIYFASNDPANPYVSPTVVTNRRGQFTIFGIPPAVSQSLEAFYNGPAPGTDQGSVFYAPDQLPVSAMSDYFVGTFAVDGIAGAAALADGSPCGTLNDFFDVSAGATAERVDSGVKTGPVATDVYGQYTLADPFATGGGTATIRCERAKPVNVTVEPLVDDPQSFGFAPAIFTDSTPPVITAINVTLGGTLVGSLLNPPSNFPSDVTPSREQFLTRKGVDSRMGACQYYKAIGAVAGCDSSGNLVGGITFEDWKKATHMAPYTRNGRKEATAVFVNRADLNIARNHHSISYGPNNTAAYVCNGLGPAFTAVSGDADVTQAVSNAAAGLNKIACVAMDYMVTPGVNGGAPFVRFIIFGPDGNVLPSINLDGRAEKFMPGVCVACHGGTNYAGKFPEDGTGLPDLGSHFLPYDIGNFLFSANVGLRRQDQEAQIKKLNLIVLNGTGPSAAEVNLINGWYAPNLSAATLNTDYIPANWDAQDAGPGDVNGPNHRAYREVIAPMCRSCHVALPERYNWDDEFDAAYIAAYGYDDGNLQSQNRVCGSFTRVDRNYSMPNSLVTFNRFWVKSGNPGDPNQVWVDFLNANGFTDANCLLGSP